VTEFEKPGQAGFIEHLSRLRLDGGRSFLLGRLSAASMNKFVLWDLDDDPHGNVRHIPIDEHLTKEDVENAVRYASWMQQLVMALAETRSI
jgi:hypothetical protein